MMKLKTKVTLPAAGLSGFETPLTEEEAAVQAGVHRFAREVLRPLGSELDKMTAEEVIAPGSPYYSVFAEYAKLGLDPAMLAELPPEIAIRMESLIGEELGWGDAGLAVIAEVAGIPAADGGRHGQAGARRTLHRQDRLLDDHAPRQGQRRDAGRHHARVAGRPAGQQGQHVGPRPGRRDRHQRPVLGLGVQRRGRAGRARLHRAPNTTTASSRRTATPTACP